MKYSNSAQRIVIISYVARFFKKPILNEIFFDFV